jgi:uncharacterized membrane protein YccF (DUF307 family)
MIFEGIMFITAGIWLPLSEIATTIVKRGAEK